LRITYLHQYFNTRQMPGGTRSYEMARRLVDWGHEVNVVTSWRQETADKGWRVTEEDGISVHWVPVPYRNEMPPAKRVHAFLKFSWYAASRAATLGGDVVFATSTPLTIALPAVYAARRCRVPMVFEVRDLWPEMPIAMGALRGRVSISLAKWLERFAYRNSKRIVALSPGMAEGVAATGYPKEFVQIIPNSADIDLFGSSEVAAGNFREEHPELGNRQIVLYAGTLGRVNGVDYLVRLADVVKSKMQSLCFVVIGSGADERRVRGLAVQLGVLGRNFYMYPKVPKAAVAEAYAAASLVTSLFEPILAMEKNSANKFFDGLAAGRAVAINYGGWQAELIQKQKCGVVLPRDVTRAADIVMDCLSSSEWLTSAGVAARNLAETDFSRDLLARRLEQTLIAAVEA
jgi:glycosyltransferase involved in cell wall biosynthesis